MLSNNNISSKLHEAIRPALEQLALTTFGRGINALGSTIKSWGTSVATTKDEFVEWVKLFLNVDGFKSGVASLYEKLIAWVKIVYDWFTTKFITFIKNIPKMVENWKELRLSLFKWGTFLGGGGGQALLSMFGSGANWEKLGALMGHPNFEEMMNDFNALVQENPNAFEELGAEGMEEIMEEYLNNPDKAKEAAKELIKEQEEKKAQESEEKQKEEPLTAEEIREKFKPSKTGNPKDVEAVLGDMAAWGLDSINKLSRSSLDGFNIEQATKLAKAQMEEYVKALEEETKNEKKKSPKKEFLESLSQEERTQLIDYFTKLAVNVYKENPTSTFDDISKQFSEKLINSVTEDCDSDSCDADGLPEKLKVGKKPVARKTR